MRLSIAGESDPIEFDEDERWLRVGRGAYELLCNFSHTEPRRFACDGGHVELADSRLVPHRLLGLPALTGSALATYVGSAALGEPARVPLGRVIVDACHTCRGAGLVGNRVRTIEVTIPPGVENGDVFGLGDPHHFLKGYIAMWILNQYARTGKLLKGWFNPGSGVITKANIATIVKRETNNQTRYAYYKATITKELADPSAYIKPLAQAGGN